MEKGEYTVSLTVEGPGGIDTKTRKDYIEVKGGGGWCDRSSHMAQTSATELATGWVIVGLCWGGGYYLVRRISRRKK